MPGTLFDVSSPIGNLLLALVCGVFGMIFSIVASNAPPSYAIVHSQTHEEARYVNRSELIPRRAWIVSMLAVAVSATAVLVTYLVRS